MPAIRTESRRWHMHFFIKTKIFRLYSKILFAVLTYSVFYFVFAFCNYDFAVFGYFSQFSMRNLLYHLFKFYYIFRRYGHQYSSLAFREKFGIQKDCGSRTSAKLRKSDFRKRDVTAEHAADTGFSQSYRESAGSYG